MNFAPMLAVLFIAARMRALNMDPINGNPQKWAQNCFFMCTYALLAQTCFSVAVPLVLQGEVKTGKVEGDMEYTVENKAFGTLLAVGRYIMMICLDMGCHHREGVHRLRMGSPDADYGKLQGCCHV